MRVTYHHRLTIEVLAQADLDDSADLTDLARYAEEDAAALTVHFRRKPEELSAPCTVVARSSTGSVAGAKPAKP